MTNEIKRYKEQMHEIHPRIPDAYTSLQDGKVSRREFLRFATLLGMSATLASACTALDFSDGSITGVSSGNDLILPTAKKAAKIVRGGSLKIGAEFQPIRNPAQLEWVQSSNVVRQVAEYLTLTDENNLTTPYLLERWGTNNDVTEWTLSLRKGILFNNGEELIADDLIFNFKQWLDPNIGSSMLGLLSYLNGVSSVEKVDNYTVKLSLSTPNIGVPEHLFHFPAAIMHRSFEGDFIQQPIGTGPFTLAEFVEGDRAVLKRRDDYWQLGDDGAPLPYLDEVIFNSVNKDTSVALIQSGEIDTFTDPRPEDFLLLKDNPEIIVQSAPTASTLVLRVRVDQGPPWNDVRVRSALRKIQNRKKILSLAYFDEGDLGTDAHVAPVHPAYAARAVPEYDPAGAKRLLEEWAADTGGTLPIRATIVTKNDGGEKEYAEVLQEDAAGTGFEFDLDITDPSGFWERWDKVPVGITWWSHKPLGTMVLPLTYTADANGVPVPWNETRWVDLEFSAVLKEAEGTLDITERREKIGRLMDIFQERGPIGIAFFKNVWRIHSRRVHNLTGHPTNYELLERTWVDQT
ncbi:MAG: ABC transporter substrate-binding protein [Anaerolineae bacterium]